MKKPTDDDHFRSFVRAAQSLRSRSALADGKLHEVRVVAFGDLATGKIQVMGGENLHEEWVIAFATQMRKFDLRQDLTHFHKVRGLAGKCGNAKAIEWLKQLKALWSASTSEDITGTLHLGAGKWADLDAEEALERWLYGNWVHEQVEYTEILDELAAYPGMKTWDAAKAVQVLVHRVECILKLELFVSALLQGKVPNLEQIQALWHEGIVQPPQKIWVYLWLSTPDHAAAILRGEEPTSSPIDELIKSAEEKDSQDI